MRILQMLMGSRVPFPNFSVLLLCASLTVFSRSAIAAEPLVVRHNFYVDQNSETLNYKGEVLALVLEKSKSRYGPYVMKKVDLKDWSQSRTYNQLEHGQLDLISSMTSEAREKAGLPIRYCLYKGLLGIRIGMGSEARVAELDQIQTREQLNKVKFGQVFDWPDYAIQTHAGLQVLPLTSVASSIPRLKMGSFDLLPLGVVEVAPIARQHGLKVISTWAIAYPTAYYFFVDKNRPELAERMAYGFEQAIKDHSFDRLFSKRIGPLIADAGLANRKMFYIRNPYLPKATPLERKELWDPLVNGRLQ